MHRLTRLLIALALVSCARPRLGFFGEPIEAAIRTKALYDAIPPCRRSPRALAAGEVVLIGRIVPDGIECDQLAVLEAGDESCVHMCGWDYVLAPLATGEKLFISGFRDLPDGKKYPRGWAYDCELADGELRGHYRIHGIRTATMTRTIHALEICRVSEPE